jgi:hypothetical protein
MVNFFNNVGRTKLVYGNRASGFEREVTPEDPLPIIVKNHPSDVPIPVLVRNQQEASELSFIERLCLKALSKLTYSLSGLRVDAGGSSVTASIAASQTLATVTTVQTVNASNAVAMGRASADGQGIQISCLAYQQGFRRNLIVS